MVKLVPRTYGDLSIYKNWQNEKGMNKVAKLNTKLVNILQGNETIIFGVNFF